MKKLLVVLLSLGLIVAFAATAPAATSIAKFGGAYYVAGIYDNNRALVDDSARNSVAVFHQRFRMGIEFKVQEGLSFSTRFDAMEKHWGDVRWSGANPLAAVDPGGDTNSSRRANPVNNQKVQENVEFEYSFITFKTGIGQFDVGYQDCDGWGTWFSNASNSRPAIRYMTAMGPMTMGFKYEKWYEADASTANNNKVDADWDIYGLFGIYKWKSGEAGFLYRYIYSAVGSTLAGTAAHKTKVSQVSPYFKANLGPVALEGELNYFFGKAREWTNGIPAGLTGDVDAETLTAYLAAQFNMGPAYMGARFAYASGNDPNDPHAAKQLLGQGTSYQPLLILGGGDSLNWMDGRVLGGLKGAAGAAAGINDKKFNFVSYNLYGGYKVTPKLELATSLGYVTAAEDPVVGQVSKKMGMELDLTANYKIYDNLSYWVGFGYLWAGDYWKGTNAANKVDDDYVLMNRLMVTF